MRFFAVRTAQMSGIEFARSIVPPFLWAFLYRKLVVKDIPDADFYKPHFQPWRTLWFVELHKKISSHTVVTIERCWTLWQMANQVASVKGDIMETGVFQGGTAYLLRKVAEKQGKDLYLFDSFEGMKVTDAKLDRHLEGDFSDTSVEAVQRVVGAAPFIHYCKGWVPDSFASLEDRSFSFAHIDLDLYQGIFDALSFVYPRMPAGGVIVCDDYGFASCPGARRAVEDFFSDKPEKPLALLTAQALIVKL